MEDACRAFVQALFCSSHKRPEWSRGIDFHAGPFEADRPTATFNFPDRKISVKVFPDRCSAHAFMRQYPRSQNVIVVVEIDDTAEAIRAATFEGVDRMLCQ